ncbi:hypothetical protein EUX98_g3506 [Antrodiella citrinella]|uniref:Ubiquitin carboxyl-terminal hydrolase n=1 Tax=Antrodiella citrinella TaxID=2447956 RepID=A0A4S4MWF3_9APHY|nr:hypothetical protein EUX98_g3506 [Antrodiella citrinella]
MIATQLYPAPTFSENRDRDAAQYLPAKDVESFNKLLPPPIEFVEGSSSGTLAIGDGKYQPINGSPTTVSKNDNSSETRPPQLSSTPSAAPQAPSAPAKSLWTHPIETSWPSSASMGCGLNNTGNTCFLNSALQCLIHTPPLVRVLNSHQGDQCRVKKGTFCMSCALRNVMRECFSRTASTTPYQITSKLSEIAKYMRRGRQEDSHEFLRYAIDALQKSCLAGLQKPDHKLAVTTWVHKIFGGKLRSRVACKSCGYNSDTFDDMLDLSVDIYGVDSLQKALRKFVAVDHLKGADKYKCDKCKKHVSADKSFTVHEAPVVLGIHLKRFSPMGRKMANLVRYDDQLTLQPVMSEGQFGPTYSLYGVISHAGGGPNSGHYYAHIKNAHGQWFEMNDESVTRLSGAPTSMKNAYILFYIQNKGSKLEAAVSTPIFTSKKPLATPPTPPLSRTGLVAGMKKRKVEQDEQEKTSKPFIGPRRPDSPPETKKLKPSLADPQAQLLKQKIASASQRSPTKASPTKALLSLSQYQDDDDDDDDDVGEKVTAAEGKAGKKSDEDKEDTAIAVDAPKSPALLPSPALTEPSLPPLSSSATASSSSVGPVTVSSFYSDAGSKFNNKKRQLDDADDVVAWAKTPLTPPKGRRNHAFGVLTHAGNPFSRIAGGNNLRQQRDNSGAGTVKRMKKRSMAV